MKRLLIYGGVLAIAFLARDLTGATLVKNGASLTVPPVGPGVRRIDSRYIGVGEAPPGLTGLAPESDAGVGDRENAKLLLKS